MSQIPIPIAKQNTTMAVGQTAPGKESKTLWRNAAEMQSGGERKRRGGKRKSIEKMESSQSAEG
jgi:hypothetical protein